MTAPNEELVRAIYAEWQAGEFTRRDHYDPDIRFSFDYGLDEIRAQGIDDMARTWAEHLRLWDHWSTGPIERMVPAGERLVVVHKLQARGKASGLDTEMLAGAVIGFRDGRVAEMRFYGDVERAFAEAGIEPE
jgi:ketosteroid isomerase-like protein